MTQKQTILGRISQLARANINALLDNAEDPEKMLDQLVRDYTNSISEAEEAVAVTIANVRMAEADLKADEEAAEEWGRKASAASRKAEEMRSSGDVAGAEKFDNLTRMALGRQIQHEDDVASARPAIEQQNATVEQLKQGLVSMKTKLEDLKSRRGTLVARARTAEAQSKVHDAISSIDVMDPNSELSRFEDRIRRQEAMVQGRAEAQATRLEDQFAELEDHTHDREIEARMQQLKGGQSS
ncbi:PspA/IM30 family protein [Ornithinimicrobium sediminis]|uniref:PspA/IM30 family protein n=1 Tax=Ornithinimicrobium sediminis TaxID=2904603 RepID=UPI001E4F6CEE|nr:PspA/IM30 family protein [Ornithinimicrobium sediminis]MCE0485651.1 PspA/IM30 family protein [Ornithinimicrobium sediminis]